MALTNHERVGKAIDLLKEGLGPFVEREFSNRYGSGTLQEAQRFLGDDRLAANRPISALDASLLLRLMWDAWNEVFRTVLGYAERSLVSELREVRNRWAHQEPFSSDDADRALDSTARLLTAVSASQAEEVTRMKLELRRIVYEEQIRGEKRKAGGSLIESSSASNLQPWREVITPHADVASGRYQQAEFAADLWQVYRGEGSAEYRDPEEFFRRTYLTESLNRLLTAGIRRLSGEGGDPVVQLQTNFGGGKTHSMLALFHLFSGVAPGSLSGVEAVLKAAGVSSLPSARRIVLVGTRISPGNPSTKTDGTVVRTLWGELAWQLGGKEAFAKVRADDEKATSPGDTLRELFLEYGPCLVLIDEWVAYARQLHDQSDLPAGSFETQFTFAQALTESARVAENCLVVISLPASDTATSPHAVADDVEVGGERGRAALARLRNVVGRMESSWTPATAEEGFEIVRRRLFEPLGGQEAFKYRDVTARAFADLYRSQGAEFPAECRDGYERRIQAAYPIHPEIFDRLYSDWSTLVKFQRTRGVLRLMAAVIHCLWERGDQSPLILPSMIPIDDPRVRDELTRYLSDNWKPIIEKDVDGPDSLPLRIDSEATNLGKLHATRRVARTIYLGSAPTGGAAHRGIEDRRVKLGCVMPGESSALFGDALRRLAGAATYLYQDGTRYWYSTQPTVTRTAEERAEQLTREPDKVAQELERRLRLDLSRRGDFARVHALPGSPGDVPDDFDARLVVLSAEQAYSKEPGNPAEKAAETILSSKGSAPRLLQNTLVFLAPDKVRLQDLDEALRKYLAWESIVAEKESLNLDPQQVRQAESRKQVADSTVSARLPETYQWLLVPIQSDPKSPMRWEALRLLGAEPLAARASRKLKRDELVVSLLGTTILRKHLDEVPLWRGDDVSVGQLAEDFARYLYLPRLQDSSVLMKAIESGTTLLTWRKDAFAYAESYDESGCRYRGLRCGKPVSLGDGISSGLLVKPEVALRQLEVDALEREKPETGDVPGGGDGGGEPATVPGVDAGDGEPASPVKLKRFHGSVTLDAARLGRDAGQIAEEVVSHLAGLVGSKVRVTLEIEAEIANGAPDHVVRTVTENCRTLKFETLGFEEE